MRQKYATTAIVLSRAGINDANIRAALLTPDFGLVRARVQGVRKPGAKLAPAMTTLSESDVSLLHGREGWRLSGAAQVENHFSHLSRASRLRAGRIVSLILRLVRGERADTGLFFTLRDFLRALPALSEEEQDAAECLAALNILGHLGLDAGERPETYEKEALAQVAHERKAIVARVNRGIQASGL